MNDSLASVVRLWPGATLSRRPGRRPALVVLPSAENPRILVPSGVRAAHVMLNRHSGGRLHRFRQAAASGAVRSGLLPFLPVARITVGRAGSVEEHVRNHVPGAARVGVLLGPPRANAKPVLQVFGSDGSTLAFAKVGDGPVAKRLVSHEAHVLADPALATLTSTVVPPVIDFGSWEGMDVLLLGALSSSQRRRSTWELPVLPIQEVAESAPVTWSPVLASAYWTDLTQRAAGLASPRGERLRSLLGATAAHLPGTALGFGRWHGDWAPWNMGFADGRLELWDWEQSAAQVPLGFDAVHFVLQRLFRDEASPQVVLDALLTEAPAVLDRWYADPEPVRATVTLYVLEVLHRYLSQAERQETAQLTARLVTLLAVADLLVGAAQEPAQHGGRRTSMGGGR